MRGAARPTVAAARAIQRAACLGDECSCYTANDDLQRARELNLTGADISDLALLKGMSNLQYLKVAHTRVKDLSPLAALENLRSIYGVTAALRP